MPLENFQTYFKASSSFLGNYSSNSLSQTLRSAQPAPKFTLAMLVGKRSEYSTRISRCTNQLTFPGQ